MNVRRGSFVLKTPLDGMAVADEVADFELEVVRQQIVFKQNVVLQCLVPMLNLALGLGMVGCSPNMLLAVVMKPVGQVGGDVGRAIVTEQAGLVNHTGLIAA